MVNEYETFLIVGGDFVPIFGNWRLTVNPIEILQRIALQITSKPNEPEINERQYEEEKSNRVCDNLHLRQPVISPEVISPDETPSLQIVNRQTLSLQPFSFPTAPRTFVFEWQL